MFEKKNFLHAEISRIYYSSARMTNAENIQKAKYFYVVARYFHVMVGANNYFT